MTQSIFPFISSSKKNTSKVRLGGLGPFYCLPGGVKGMFQLKCCSTLRTKAKLCDPVKHEFIHLRASENPLLLVVYCELRVSWAIKDETDMTGAYAQS